MTRANHRCIHRSPQGRQTITRKGTRAVTFDTLRMYLFRDDQEGDSILDEDMEHEALLGVGHSPRNVSKREGLGLPLLQGQHHAVCPLG